MQTFRSFERGDAQKRSLSFLDYFILRHYIYLLMEGSIYPRVESVEPRLHGVKTWIRWGGFLEKLQMGIWVKENVF